MRDRSGSGLQRRRGGARPGPRTYALIAGGGTAGHVLPALAIARALVARGQPADAVHFAGARRGPEARIVPDAGFAITLLPGRGIARRLTVANLQAGLGIAAAVGRGLALVARRRPSVVVSVGGYASLPCSLAAVLLRVPLVVHEQNAIPGAANRIAGRFARACAVSFPGTPLPRATVTGNPVRPEVAAVDRSPAARREARRTLGLPVDRVVVAVFGGSLGSRRINDAVFALARRWSDRGDVAIRHAVGSRDWAVAQPQLPGDPGSALVYQAVEYEDRMPLLLSAADVAVCRAGGSTVAELAVVGLPAVLVPLPIAAADHQTANARALVGAGAALLVPDEQLDGPRLESELGPLVASAARREAMAAAARSQARPDAADRVAELVERHARP